MFAKIADWGLGDPASRKPGNSGKSKVALVVGLVLEYYMSKTQLLITS